MTRPLLRRDPRDRQLDRLQRAVAQERDRDAATRPGEQQLDSLDELRARANDEVSVLVISGDPAAGQQLARTGERHRAPVEFLAKPIDPDVLVNRVQLVVAEP